MISRKSNLIKQIGIILIVGGVTSVSTIYTLLINSNIFIKLDNYVLATDVSFAQMLEFAFKGLLFEIPLIIIFIYLLYKREKKIEGWDYTLVAMLVTECCFWGICSINPVFMRFSYYYQLSFFWIIPRIIELVEKKFLFRIGIVIYILIRMFLFYFVWGYDSIIPYSFA